MIFRFFLLLQLLLIFELERRGGRGHSRCSPWLCGNCRRRTRSLDQDFTTRDLRHAPPFALCAPCLPKLTQLQSLGPFPFPTLNMSRTPKNAACKRDRFPCLPVRPQPLRMPSPSLPLSLFVVDVDFPTAPSASRLIFRQNCDLNAGICVNRRLRPRPVLVRQRRMPSVVDIRKGRHEGGQEEDQRNGRVHCSRQGKFCRGGVFRKHIT